MFAAEMDGRLSGLTGDGSGATVAAYAGTALLKQVACQLPAKFDKDDVYRQLLSQKVVRTASGDYPITERCVDFPLITKEIRAGKVSIAAH